MLSMFLSSGSAFTLALFGTTAAQDVKPETGQIAGPLRFIKDTKPLEDKSYETLTNRNIIDACVLRCETVIV
jgi:hypothetical protein